jgi:hypothetical protein
MIVSDEDVTEPHSARTSTLRVRLHRERRRDGLRLLTLEIPESAIDAAIARGFLKPEDSAQAWSVIESVYATQLSDKSAELAHRQCGDHSGTTHQCGCDPPLHQRLAGGCGSMIKRQ